MTILEWGEPGLKKVVLNCIQYEGEASPVALILTHTAPDTCWWGWQDCKRIGGKDGGGGVKVPYNTEYQPNTAGGGRSGKENCVQRLSGWIYHRMKHIEWSQKYTANAGTLIRHGSKYLLIKKNGRWNIEGWHHLNGQESVKKRVDYSVSLTH